MMLHYDIYQKNKTNDWIVLLHGLGGNSRIWYKQKRALMKRFNVIFVDLHGHGKSKIPVSEFKHHEIEDIAKDVLKILDSLGIRKAAFMGVSLGSIVARAVGLIAPERVRFFILVGAVLKFNFFSNCLLKIGGAFKGIMPYMWLYKLFALIMMPKKNHKSSRSIFVREAVKLGREEFLFWFNLAKKVNLFHSKVKSANLSIPTQYIMGNEDHMFVHIVKKEMNTAQNTCLFVIQNSGHLCNIEKPEEFNSLAIDYINNQL